MEGQEASKQFKEEGDTHEPKSTTTTTTHSLEDMSLEDMSFELCTYTLD